MPRKIKSFKLKVTYSTRINYLLHSSERPGPASDIEVAQLQPKRAKGCLKIKV